MQSRPGTKPLVDDMLKMDSKVGWGEMGSCKWEVLKH